MSTKSSKEDVVADEEGVTEVTKEIILDCRTEVEKITRILLGEIVDKLVVIFEPVRDKDSPQSLKTAERVATIKVTNLSRRLEILVAPTARNDKVKTRAFVKMVLEKVIRELPD